MSADGKNIKQDTKFLLTTTPLGGFCVEVETPGTLSQQRTFYLADYTSKHLTYAMLDSFMGPNALDPVAQLDIGACFLYFANGFKFDSADNDPRRIEESEELLQNIDLYFHPSGVMMAPEGQTVPGMKEIPGEETVESQQEPESAPASSSGTRQPSGAPGGLVGSRPSSNGGSAKQTQTAAAALTLTRGNFSLPQLSTHDASSSDVGADSQPGALDRMAFRPQEAMKGLLGRLGKLRLGWKDDTGS